MKEFRAKNNIVIGLITVLSLLAFIVVENNKDDVKQEWYNEKIEAAKLSQKAAKVLKFYRLEKGVFVDATNDPHQTALIGQEYSLITTGRGDIEAKLASTNPNMAAVVVQLLKEAGVTENDVVAVAFTGSFPALNISVMAAMQTLKLKPIIITSVGSSNWGANDPYFTWLDMEDVLVKSNVFQHRSIAASIGGGVDIGRGLSPDGIDLILKSIERNNTPLIKESNLEKSINRRMEIYKEHSKSLPIKAYINVGGGIASLGNAINGSLIPEGLTPFIPQKNFPVRGVMIQMGQEHIPVIHLLNIDKIISKYGLQSNETTQFEPGIGKIFVNKKYNILIISIALGILIIIILYIYFVDKKYHKLGTDVVPISSVSATNKEKNSSYDDFL